jgi:hypothetical protein
MRAVTILIASVIAALVATFASGSLATVPAQPLLTNAARNDLNKALQTSDFPVDGARFVYPNGLLLTLQSSLGMTAPVERKIIYSNSRALGFKGQAISRVVGDCEEVQLVGWEKTAPTHIVRVTGTYCLTSELGQWEARSQTVTIAVEPGGPPDLMPRGSNVVDIGY